MRFWEIILIILAVFQLVVLVGPAGLTHLSEVMARMPLAAGLATGVHLIFERPRWQMAPIYICTIIFAALLLWRWRSTLGDGPVWRWSLAITGVITLGLGLTLSMSFPIPDLPEPTGPFAVGTVTYHLVDSSRPELYTADPEDVRELMVQIWYPAKDNPQQPRQTYFPKAERMISAIAEALDLPAFLLNHLKLIKSYAKADLPLADGTDRYPVILFSHGYGSTRIQSTVLMEGLASHGYVVASLDHPYGAAITVFPDGRVALLSPDALTGEGDEFRRSGIRLVNGWEGDLAYALDQLARMNSGALPSPFADRLDLDRIGVMGHSTGGGATARFCGRDSRCRAAVGLDAWLGPVPDERLTEGTGAPFLFFMTEFWPKPENIGYIETYMENSPGSTWLTLAGSNHYDFSDAPFISPLLGMLGLDIGLEPRLGHQITEKVVLAFFNDTLRGQDGRFLEETQHPLLLFNQDEIFNRAAVR